MRDTGIEEHFPEPQVGIIEIELFRVEHIGADFGLEGADIEAEPDPWSDPAGNLEDAIPP